MTPTGRLIGGLTISLACLVPAAAWAQAPSGPQCSVLLESVPADGCPIMEPIADPGSLLPVEGDGLLPGGAGSSPSPSGSGAAPAPPAGGHADAGARPESKSRKRALRRKRCRKARRKLARAKRTGAPTRKLVAKRRKYCGPRRRGHAR
jgi:hypothetical protein